MSKSRILIIEDNYCKFFAAKQVLESQLKMTVTIVNTSTVRDLASKASAYNPDLVLYRPAGGVTELLAKMQRRGTNRRNSEIVLMLAEEFDGYIAREVENFMSELAKGTCAYASAA